MQNSLPKIADHKKCIETLKQWFNERGIDCEDFELQIGNAPIKRPDLVLPQKKVLIEVKTYKPTRENIEKEKDVKEQLRLKGMATWWHTHFRDRFADDLEDSRRMFRNFPDYSSLVIFFDLTSWPLRQQMEELLAGELSVTVAVPRNPEEPPYIKGKKFKERSLRIDLNREIGAVAIVKDRNAFTIYHNDNADDVRKIPTDIFSTLNDIQKIYIDDAQNPRIVDLK